MRPHLAAFRRAIAVAVGAPLLSASPAGASTPPDTSPLPDLATLDGIDASPDACPLAFGDALGAAGLEPAGDIEVDVHHARPLPPASSIPVDELTPLDLSGGVIVECRTDVDGVTVAARLHASPNERATIGTFIPIIAIEGEISGPDVQPVVNRMSLAPQGGFVDISDLTDAPIAVVRPVVDGAADATLVVHADDGDESGGSDESEAGGSTAAELDPEVDVWAIASTLAGAPAVHVTEEEFVAAASDRYGLPEVQARCVYDALGGDVSEILGGSALDLSGEALQGLADALADCDAPMATSTP